MSRNIHSTQIAHLMKHYDIEVGVKPKKETMKKIKATYNMYKVALKDSKIKNARVTSKKPKDTTTTTKKIGHSKRVVEEYTPKTSVGAIKLSSGNKIHRLRYTYKKETAIIQHHGVVIQSNDVKTEIQFRVDLYKELIDQINNFD